MKYNTANVEKIAWRIVEDMTRGDLEMFVYEDMIHIMRQARRLDEELFHANVDTYKEK